MSKPCDQPATSGPSSTNDSAQSAGSDATTSAASPDAPAATTPPTSESFSEGIRKIAEQGRVSREDAHLAHLREILLDRLHHCGLALHKVTTVKKDRGAKPDLIADAAMAHRQIERDALAAINEYVDAIAAREAAREQESGQ